jgi:hypothetical protein
VLIDFGFVFSRNTNIRKVQEIIFEDLKVFKLEIIAKLIHGFIQEENIVFLRDIIQQEIIFRVGNVLMMKNFELQIH